MTEFTRNPEEIIDLYVSLLEQNPDAIFFCDSQGNLLDANPAFEQLTGYTVKELIHTPIVALAANARVAADWEHRHAKAVAGQPQQYDVTIRNKDGRNIPLRIKDIPALIRGKLVGVHSVGRDISEQKHLENRLRYLAEHDELTGLFNRTKFDERLRNELALSRRYNTYGALLLIDLDEFKDINDSYGHEAGNRYIVEIAEAIREQLRDTDVLARLGGDEFAVLLPHTSRDEAEKVAGALLEAFNHQQVTFGEQSVYVSASIGIALYPDHAESGDDLLSLADLAMYRAKQSGRNRCAVYSFDQKLEKEAASKLSWRSRLLGAIENDAFTLYSQPILNLQTNHVYHHELLLRMQENGKVISPGVFIHYAERYGMIQTIDRWVIDQAISMLNQVFDEDEVMRLSVNISGSSLLDDELLAFVTEKFATSNCKPSRLVFEITETDAIADLYKARSVMEELRNVGCRFSLDDYGMGFSSLYYLKNLPVNYIKIDGSFVRELRHNRTDQEMVKSIVGMAHALGKKTVAEHVEDAATLELLRSFGVDFAQGYYIGRPAKVTELPRVTRGF